MDRTPEPRQLIAPKKHRKAANHLTAYDDSNLSPIEEERAHPGRLADPDCLSERYSADIESNSNRSFENFNDRTASDDLENGLRPLSHSGSQPLLRQCGDKLFCSSEESGSCDGGKMEARLSLKLGETPECRESLLPKEGRASEELRDDPVRGIVYYLVHTVLLTV